MADKKYKINFEMTDGSVQSVEFTAFTDADKAEMVNDVLEQIPDSEGAVLYTEQNLTEEQKAQARENIGAGEKSALDTFLDNVDVDYAYDVNTGVNYTVIRVYRDRIDGSKQYPFVVAPDGDGEQKHSALTTAHQYGYLLTINAGLGTGSPKLPDGVIVENSEVIVNDPANYHAGAIPLTIDADGNLGYATSGATGEELAESGIVSAVCGFCPIIVNYEPVDPPTVSNASHFTENAQRQIIGQFGNGDYAIVTCEGRGFQNSDGWTIAEAQSICQKHGLKFAYNLDGGGSTATVLGKKQINTIYEGNAGRVVPTFIVFNGRNSYDGGIVQETYTFVDYITASLDQYINTQIPETDVYDIEYKAMNTIKTTSSTGHILSSTNTYTPFLRFGENGEMVLCKTKGVENTIYYDYDSDNPAVVTQNVNGTNVTLKVNGSVALTLTHGSTANQNNKYYLFAYGGNPGNRNYRFCGEFYYMRMWNSDGVLVRDYRAARRNSDGVLGVYDTVQGVFYRSESGKDFY